MSGYRRAIVLERSPLRAILGGALVGGVLLVAGTLAACGGDPAEGSGPPAAQATTGGARPAAAPVGARGAAGASSALGGAAGAAFTGGAAGAAGGAGVEGEPKSSSGAQLAPRTIYYDLTAFDWYRRGEPLSFGGRSYRAADVRATGERKLERGGEYQGVDIYVAPGGAERYDTLFVPVYSGYWLTFTPMGGEEAER